MIIRPDGTAAKCCNDPLNEMTLGDLNNQSILEVWRGKAYQELRKEMYFKGRRRIKGCTYCDIFGLYNYLLPYVKINEHERLAHELRIRKNLGAIYLFDIIPLSFQIRERMKVYGVEFDGMINIRNETGGVWKTLYLLKKFYKSMALYFFQLRITMMQCLTFSMPTAMNTGAII